MQAIGTTDGGWHRPADLKLTPLSASRLFQRLEHLEASNFICSLRLRYGPLFHSGKPEDVTAKFSANSDLSPAVKETNVEYQVERLAVFHRLLSAYPATEHLIKLEAKVDIPPLYRKFVWPALLGVRASDVDEYSAIDTEEPGVSDRQIEVDVPRCHQYAQLLTAPAAHEKLKRLLKAWLKSQPHLVYWQGLDSLCAPFLHMHFDNEALAFACFKAFTRKYLSGLFARHNAPFIQECLAVFAHLIAFHDPLLHVHLQEIGFSTDLYAIPWLLTMFAHALSIGRLLPVWDALISRDDRSFGLCFGVALLMAHRRILLSSGFNESILLFSDLPSIDVYACLEEAGRIYDRSPPSVAQLVHHAADSNDGRQSKTRLTKMSAGELRKLPCGRISVEDLLAAKISDGGDDKTVTWGPVMLVDVRSFEERQRSAPAGSVHVPPTTEANSGFTLPNCPGGEVLKRHRNEAVVAILTSGTVKEDTLAKFIAGLHCDGYERVCLLDDGPPALRAAGLM